jgi:hypothetical protein
MYFMDRIETYVGQSILEWNFSKPDQNKMVALGKVISALFGSTTVASGLACTSTPAASLFVNIAPGEIYQTAPLEATVCGTLPADITHTIMKQGIALDSVTVPNASTGVTAFAAPVIAGQSVNYLIEAAYADVDVSLDPTTGNSPVVLPFYNASNPTSLYQGPNGTGVTSNTFRKGTVALRVKAGTAATTGSQVTPSIDSGYVGLWVVTVAYGQTAINAANITTYAGAPILPTSMLAAIQSGSLQYGADVSATANVIQGSFPIPPTALVDNQQFWVKIKNTNTGAVTFTPNVGVISAAPVVGAAHAALQGGECVVNGRALLVWRADISSYVLESCTGAALQVAPATASQHAAQFAQLTGVVGSVRNAKMSITAAAASGTFTADEIIVSTALGGLQYRLGNFSKTINLATTGAGGMDTGTAPVSGYVALYAIYNPTTATASILATNAATLAPNVYGGANMPAGYTASALISVFPTAAAGQLAIASQTDRSVTFPFVSQLSTPAATAYASVTLTVPYNAKTISGFMQMTSSTAAHYQLNIFADSALSSYQTLAGYIAAGTNSVFCNFTLQLVTPKTVYWNANTTGFVASFSIGSYTF